MAPLPGHSSPNVPAPGDGAGAGAGDGVGDGEGAGAGLCTDDDGLPVHATSAGCTTRTGTEASSKRRRDFDQDFMTFARVHAARTVRDERICRIRSQIARHRAGNRIHTTAG